MRANDSNVLSPVEQVFLEQSGRRLIYGPAEHIPVIEVPNFPVLGKLAALRFLEWVLVHPEGVVALPTGKTPETFIRWTRHLLDTWSEPAVQRELAGYGINASKPPEIRGLRFVQIDEFYPIESGQENSFHHYIRKFYFDEIGLDPARALLINPSAIGLPPGKHIKDVFPEQRADLSLRLRKPASALEDLQAQIIRAVDAFCDEYEARIREWGGIGFFLGGIGPDGHIAFNCRGSSHHSVTRLTQLNYDTEAAAATDLGGMEMTRGRAAITIGLGTICRNPDAVAIILAAGEAKAKVVAAAVQNPPDIHSPASVIASLRQARFYLTRGAAVELKERRLADLLTVDHLSAEQTERIVIDMCLRKNKSLDELTKKDFEEDSLPREMLKRSGRTPGELTGQVKASLEMKIMEGLKEPSPLKLLHTGPHHDDVMLGYMPYIMHLVRSAKNVNEFLILTSGFTAVTNGFLVEALLALKNFIQTKAFDEDMAEGSLIPGNTAARTEEVFRYLDGIAARDEEIRLLAQSRRLLSNIASEYKIKNVTEFLNKIEELLDYFRSIYPGKKDREDIQRLKGMQREWEEELVWGYVGINRKHVSHARLGFYTGDIFTPEPTEERDVAPVLAEIRRVNPEVVSVALDPEGAGPDTHYKVLQVLNVALRRYRSETDKAPEIWGYRNVWHRFHPAEANRYIPATLNTMAIMENAFMNCFASQRAASFPSWEYDGPFCDLARRIWIDQFTAIKTCLGERYFPENPLPRLRASHGFVFLKVMNLDEFTATARDLKQVTEGLGEA